MNDKSLYSAAIFVLLIIGLTLFDLGCKKDESPTSPAANNTPYGSGTITTTSTAGSLSITGTGVWPLGTGPSVVAMYDTTYHVLLLVGYQQISGRNYNYLEFNAQMIGGVDTGTYYHPATFCDFHALYNADTLNAEADGYHRVSGTFAVSSVNGANASGTYSFLAQRGTDQPLQFTGTFNVAYVVRAFIGGVRDIQSMGASRPPSLLFDKSR